MEFFTKLLDVLSCSGIVPAFVGAVAGLYVQSDEYANISLKQAFLVFVSSLATSHFIGNWACEHWALDGNAASALKFLISAYTPDLMQAAEKIVSYYKENPMDIFKKLTKSKTNEEAIKPPAEP